MIATRLDRYCHTCNFWHWDANIYLPSSVLHPLGTVAYPGHCGLESCACINAVAVGTDKPIHYQSLEVTNEE